MHFTNKMSTATLQTTDRVLECIRIEKKPITPTTIHKLTGIAYKSVLASISKLSEWQQIEIISNGKIILIRDKIRCKNEQEQILNL